MATDGVRRRHKLLDQERSNDIAWKRFRYIISASFESTSLIDVIFFQQIYTYYCRSWWCSYYWYNTIQYNTMQCNAMQYNKLYLKSENIKHYNTSSNELLNPNILQVLAYLEKLQSNEKKNWHVYTLYTFFLNSSLFMMALS